MKAITFGGNPNRGKNQKHLLPDDKQLRLLNLDINDEDMVSKFVLIIALFPEI